MVTVSLPFFYATKWPMIPNLHQNSKQMKHYSEAQALQHLVSWQYKNIGIEKEFVFTNFSEAFAFMTRVAFLCEADNHHPEWCNVYNKVHIRLNTHSENAVTDKDIDLAKKIDALLIL